MIAEMGGKHVLATKILNPLHFVACVLVSSVVTKFRIHV